jgi:uncharacterized membrane protein (UPF0127 family)
LGLSGRASLAEGKGMLFVFEKPDTYGFWMKDMNFPIDMIFIGEDKKVVTVVAHASPESYKKNPPEVFYPAKPVLFVLEVPAGFAKEHGVEEGMVMSF